MTSDPPVIVDAAHVDRLQGLALAALKRTPEVAERLLAEVDRAQVVSSTSMPPGVVNMGSQVTYRDDFAGEVHTVTLVFPSEADIERHKVSVLTPVGAALVGLSVGASIDWQTRSGDRRRLTILNVVPPPNDSEGGHD